MPVWDVSAAVASLRSLLGDASADKFEFRVGAQPAPDGVTVRFFLGHTRLVEEGVQVVANGVVIDPSGVTLDAVQGVVTLVEVPAPSGTLEASYYYRWFTDPELQEFLTQAVNVQRFDSIDSEEMPVALRPVALDFACYYAFMRKAAEYADSLEASAGGLTVTQDKSHPNWRSLAEASFKNGKEKIQLYVDNPLNTKKPQMSFVTFGLPRYIP